MAVSKIKNLVEASESLKAMAHPLRLKMLKILSGGPASVGELAGACMITSPIASTHLRLLNDRGLVRKRRQGRQVFYRMAKPVYERVIDALI